jgi:hypothetical protein
MAANVASGGLAAGPYDNAMTFSNPSNVFAGSFSGNGSGLSGVDAQTLAGASAGSFWRNGGNASTAGIINFLGSSDYQPLTIGVNGLSALRLMPTPDGAPNLVGGSGGNLIMGWSSGSSILGGGANAPLGCTVMNNTIAANNAFIGSGSGNVISLGADSSSIVGGDCNAIQTNSAQAFIGGGVFNLIKTTSSPNGSASSVGGGSHNSVGLNNVASAIGGGLGNRVGDNLNEGTVSGGFNNLIQAGAHGAAIGGGARNEIQVDSTSSFIGGGSNNTIRANIGVNSIEPVGATIGGGLHNTIETAGGAAFIGGGFLNSIESVGAVIAGGTYNRVQASSIAVASTIGGGDSNTVGLDSPGATIGGGQNNVAGNGFATVGGGDYNSATGWIATVGGGGDNEAAGHGATVPGGAGNHASGEFSFAAGVFARANHDRSFVWSSYLNPAGTFATDRFHVLCQNGLSVDFDNQRVDGGGSRWILIGAPSPNTIVAWNGALLTDSGVWANASDRNRKRDFQPANPEEVLKSLLNLPIQTWRYTNETAEVRHIGPTAQDFADVFGYGTDNTTIGTVDEGGVALAAIQGLNQKLEAQWAELSSRQAEIDELKRRLSVLERLVSSASH